MVFIQIIESGAHNSLVLEDDVYFKPNFRRDLISMMNEVKNNDFIYDLM